MVLTVLVVLHLAAAACAPLLVRAWGRRAFLALALVPAAACAWVLAQLPAVLGGAAVVEERDWVPTLGLTLDLRLGALQALLALLVTGVGALVLAYCTWYFGDDEPRLGRFAATFTAFAGVMLGLVVADDLLLLYVFWELTSVLSYLLIGQYPEVRASRRAARQALVVTTAGGLTMLVGIVLLGSTAGTYRISAILDAPPTGRSVAVAVLLLLVGAVSKSALVPFSFWLPAAMQAPTPVSAYLHAAAMVKAGVYLVALLAPAFAAQPDWRPVVLLLGGATMLLGGWRALRQHDLKLLLAYGTISQLGFLVLLLGVGTRTAALAGAAMLLAHGLFKAALFLVVGIVDHAAGTRDLRRLSGLRRALPGSFWAAALAAASMAGVPPLLGFAAKESALEAFTGTAADGVPAAGFVLAVVVVGSVLTAAYSWRFVAGAFGDRTGGTPTEVHAVARPMTAVPLVLAALGVLLGLGAPLVDALVQPYAAAYALPPSDLPGTEPPYVALWHGLTLPLALSALVLGTAAALARSAPAVERFQAGTADRWRTARFDLAAAYAATTDALERVAVRVTGATQRGSLPVYVTTTLLTLVALASASLLLRRIDWLPVQRWWDSPAQLGVALVTAFAALAVVRSRRRLSAAVLAGVVGYGTAMLFVLQGAPDLALTQLLVETLTVVVFVLVLRRLPARFTRTRSPRWRKALHAAVAVTVAGIAVSGTYAALGARTAPSVSAELAVAAAEAEGANVVNVALVDLRAWDTMGEISVLTVAAIGVTSLVFLTRRQRHLPRVGAGASGARVWARDDPRDAVTGDGPSGREPRQRWLAAGGTLAPERRSVVVEVVASLAFHAMVVLSVYLLLAGHNGTGGGFAGGMVAGLALVLRYLAGGRYELGEAAPVGPGTLMGLGLLCATGTAVGGLLLGDDVLRATVVDLTAPLVGEVHVATSTLFDVGVYLVVVGLVLDLLRAFGAELDRQVETGEGEPPQEAADQPAQTTASAP